MRVTVHVDGGSRGNAGPAAAAAVVSGPDGEVIDQAHATLGVTTNNVAEYRGLLLGLERARALGATEVDVVRPDQQAAHSPRPASRASRASAENSAAWATLGGIVSGWA